MTQEPIEVKVANQLATGAGGKITLGGKDYIVAQPTDHDMMSIALECERIIKRKRNEQFVALVREFKDVQLARQTMDEMERLGSGGLLSVETGPGKEQKVASAMFDGAIGDVDGTRFMAFILLRKSHPELTIDAMQTLITPANAAIVAIELLNQCGLAKAVPNSPGANGSP